MLQQALPSQWAKNIKINTLGYLLVVGWTLILLTVLTWNWAQVRKDTHKEALIALEMTVTKDLTFRNWATNHGGIYVPLANGLEPNPYLEHLPQRDITTINGAKLTLLNPAYIMRQVYQLRMDSLGIYNRLTSLDPVNPINAADSWEANALARLQTNEGLARVSAITDFNGEPAIRLIMPFYMEEGCLKCHQYQGREIGDLHGGISASTPLARYSELIHARRLALLPGYAVIWLIGLAGILWFLAGIKAKTTVLRQQEERYRAIVSVIPDMIFRYSREGVYLDAVINSQAPAARLIQKEIQAGSFIGHQLTDLLPPTIAANLATAIQTVIATGEMQVLEHRLRLLSQTYFFEDRLVLEGENEVISVVRDITEQKKFEADLEYLSNYDKLTGLHNRNYFENQLQRLNKPENFPISIISTDVNGLKLVNDSLGHIHGDRLLISCGRLLKTSLRDTDVLARVGGDEFVAILIRTNNRKGGEILERIRTNMANHNQTCPALPVSLSLGLATAVKPTFNLVNIYKKADDMMYQDKTENGPGYRGQIIQSLVTATQAKANTTASWERLRKLCKDAGIDFPSPREKNTQ